MEFKPQFAYSPFFSKQCHIFDKDGCLYLATSSVLWVSYQGSICQSDVNKTVVMLASMGTSTWLTGIFSNINKLIEFTGSGTG